VVSSWILFFSYQDDARSTTHQNHMHQVCYSVRLSLVSVSVAALERILHAAASFVGVSWSWQRRNEDSDLHGESSRTMLPRLHGKNRTSQAFTLLS